MEQLAYIANVEVEQVLGEWHPLVDQLGATDGFVPLSSATAALALPRVTNAASLEAFLESYQAQILIPLELPSILRAYRHATRNETRELIAFDQELAGVPMEAELSRASRRVGLHQLRRFRPMRDLRLVQRYMNAVDEKQAYAWHTLVYGLTLSIYSLPVYQGLAFYERETLRGFLYTAAKHLRLSQRQCREMLLRLLTDLPERLDSLVPTRDWVVTSTR